MNTDIITAIQKLPLFFEFDDILSIDTKDISAEIEKLAYYCYVMKDAYPSIKMFSDVADKLTRPTTKFSEMPNFEKIYNTYTSTLANIEMGIDMMFYRMGEFNARPNGPENYATTSRVFITRMIELMRVIDCNNARIVFAGSLLADLDKKCNFDGTASMRDTTMLTAPCAGQGEISRNGRPSG